MDQIVVMKDGKISEIGSYDQLMHNKGAFAEFLLEQLRDIEDEEAVEDDQEHHYHHVHADVISESEKEDIKHQLEETLGVEQVQKALRAKKHSRVRTTSIGSLSVASEPLSEAESILSQASVTTTRSKSLMTKMLSRQVSVAESDKPRTV